MQSFLERFTEASTAALQRAFPDISKEALAQVEVTQSTHERFGDYQCNVAMRLSQELKMAPRAIAQALVEAFEGDHLIESIEVAGPGFINFTLSADALVEYGKEIFQDARLGVLPPSHPLRVICEYSSPNTAKEMHVGHLRSTIIGETLARLLEFVGHDVVRLNHVGDYGTQFGMLIVHLREAAPDLLESTSQIELSQLVAWYREAKERFDADPLFRKEARLAVVALQSGDPAARKTWERICAISRAGYQQIYDRLDVSLLERGESTYAKALPLIVEELKEKGLLVESEGALCAFPEGFVNREGNPLPLIVQKADGGFNYATTDLAALKQRIEEEGASWIIYVVDAGQSLHFQMVFAVARAAGWLNPPGREVRLDHVAFGLVLGPDGKRYRTRSGETERLSDLLDRAIEHAKKILQEREVEFSEEEIERTAQRLGLSAVKYADLSCHRTGDYIFSYDRMMSLEGNTAAFLFYACVRLEGIRRRLGVDFAESSAGRIQITHPTERALLLHLTRFPEAIEMAVRDLLPNRICDYLYGLAQLFHSFHRDCRVEGSGVEQERLALCALVEKVMRKGFYLLGLQPVDRM